MVTTRLWHTLSWLIALSEFSVLIKKSALKALFLCVLFLGD